ncbi:hypothetical protein [Lysinibacillus endophyticus]|uniref:hypothetical protein n=1 Tax=Ureibacillus endophyticus TaxID=1978490 RepID=UPI00313672DE
MNSVCVKLVSEKTMMYKNSRIHSPHNAYLLMRESLTARFGGIAVRDWSANVSNEIGIKLHPNFCFKNKVDQLKVI